MILKLVCSVAPQLLNRQVVKRSALFKLMVDLLLVRCLGKSDTKRELEVKLVRSKLAWTGVRTGKFSVRAKDLTGPFGTELMRCGLFKAESSEYCWLDLSFRDYLAAEYICGLRLKGNVAKKLKQCLADGIRSPFFDFVCGMGGSAVDCVSKWFPKGLQLIGHLKDGGMMSWIEEGGVNLENVVLATCSKDGFGSAMLRAAARDGCLNAVKLLIGQKVDIHSKDVDGKTALWLASLRGHLEVVACLIKLGANVNAADSYGQTALLVASENGHLSVVQLLIKQGADLRASDLYGWTALSAASVEGHSEVVKCLIV